MTDCPSSTSLCEKGRRVTCILAVHTGEDGLQEGLRVVLQRHQLVLQDLEECRWCRQLHVLLGHIQHLLQDRDNQAHHQVTLKSAFRHLGKSASPAGLEGLVCTAINCVTACQVESAHSSKCFFRSRTPLPILWEHKKATNSSSMVYIKRGRNSQWHVFIMLVPKWLL